MATFKLTIKRGQKAQDVTVAAGSTISGSDAAELNVDITSMPRSELVILLDELAQQILQKLYPQL
jgi:hypothetical protein